MILLSFYRLSYYYGSPVFNEKVLPAVPQGWFPIALLVGGTM
jgi:hypothetical protein